MNPKLKLFHRSVVVTYSKKKRMGRVTIHIPKKFVGYNANIIIYSRPKTKR